MKILNIYNVITNTSVPYELEQHMASKFKFDVFSHLRLNSIGDSIRCFWKTYRAIRDNDVIHSHHTFSSVVVSFYKIFFVGKKKLFCCTVHRNYRSAGKVKALIFSILVFPFRDKIICNSHATKASLPPYVKQFLSHRIEVAYNGVNLSSISCSINFPINKINLVNVGRLVQEKDQITLIRMCTVLSQRKVDYHLTICGGGPLEKSLKQEIIERGLSDRVSLLGNISRSNVYKNLFNASVYISTSTTEGFGNSSIEAMASGSPVLLTDIPVSAEIINCQQLMFPTGDYQELANKVQKLCEDKRYFMKVALSGIKKSKDYSLEAAANAYHLLYTKR